MFYSTGSPLSFSPSTHESKELGVVDDAVGVGVGLVQDLGDLLLGERLAQVAHHDGQLPAVDEAVAVLRGGVDNAQVRLSVAMDGWLGVVRGTFAFGSRVQTG